MARFNLFLIGSSQPVEVDFPVAGIAELNQLASGVRFLEGHMAVPNEDGVCVGVMVPTCRIQFVVEAS